MDKEKVAELAKSHAAEGFLCSESVLLAISNWLDIHCKQIPEIAAGFGAGLGGHGLVCGAISAGIMALGLKFGRNEVKKQKMKPYWFASDLLKRFDKEFGSIMCVELTGCDLTTEEGRKKYEEEKLWKTKCGQYIESVTNTVFNIISQKS